MNRNVKLELEEQELLDSYERNEWRSVNQLPERLRQYQAYALTVFEAMGLVSIALPPEDINAIREKAAATRMSCQTFIANLVHQYLAGNLVEKPRDA